MAVQGKDREGFGKWRPRGEAALGLGQATADRSDACYDACAGVKARHNWCIMLPLSQRVQPGVHTLMGMSRCRDALVERLHLGVRCQWAGVRSRNRGWRNRGRSRVFVRFADDVRTTVSAVWSTLNRQRERGGAALNA